MPERYQVPKHEATARVILSDGSRRQITVFLSERAEHHSGPERPSDLLNGDDSFVPVSFPESGFALLRTTSVMVMTVDVEDELVGTAEAEDVIGSGPGPDGVERHDVRIGLDDGSEVRGAITYLMPPGERRLQDYLNQAPTFVRLREGDRVKIVNTDRVVRVQPR